jgi:SAM-dependent methyltransferase
MSAPFTSDYSRYYDAVYRSKDYEAEARRVRRIIERFAPGARTLLELGSGTGGHAKYLSRYFDMVLVDRSSAMLRLARAKLRGRPVTFRHRDLSRPASFGSDFDGCLSLFHVMNYLTPAAFARVLDTVRHDLRPGGVFVFDSWNGAALRREGPSSRERAFELNGRRLVRRVIPRLEAKAGYCDVAIRVEEIRGRRRLLRSDEVHRMRYQFPAELRRRVASRGFTVHRITNDLGGRIGPADWSFQIVATRD